ncbi:MAG: GWxTD domain-containing protein [Acidobacteriaceae bacterium]|nr:GWxTD domain-containing protein [Acidobacteriaceae bacterium]MBV9499838.1 GWxTD domain-containing protein [Acidobacteriaceae bacterium]
MKSSPAFCRQFLVGISAAILIAGTIAAQDKPSQAGSSSSSSSSSSDQTVAKPLTKKQIAKRQKELEKELAGPWKKWLNEDVVYIITDEEKAAFKRLKTDEERQQFVEQFWLRRDPTPDTEENEYKEEHYRRIAYANDHYASGIPGWKTDRGMIYIKYGAPDEIDSHPSGGSYERPIEEGGGETSTYPFEDWRYRYIDGVGTNVIIEFVDTTMSGEYHISLDPEEKDALLYVPGAGLTMAEQMGMADKTQRFERTDGTHLGTGNQPLPESMNEFTRLEQYANLMKPPAIKFKDLDAIVNSNIKYNTLPMQVRTDFIRVTDATVYANITVLFKNNDLNFSTKDKIAKASVNIYGRITTLTRRSVNWFEDTVSAQMPAEMLQQAMNGSQIYSKRIPLAPGTYRLNIVAKDMVGNTVNNYEMALNVPHYDEDQLGASSVILADELERVPTNSIGTGQFVIRSSKVRPRVDDSFKQSETMGIYTEFYNLGMDQKTKKPEGSIEYEVVNAADNKTVLSQTEDLTTIPNASPFLVTVEKKLPLKTLAPGKYTLKLKITDKLKNQSLTPSAQFTVTS